MGHVNIAHVLWNTSVERVCFDTVGIAAVIAIVS